MTIKSVHPIAVFIVETDVEDLHTHTRYGPDSWTVRMGESDETVYECAELESAFQRFPDKGQTELAALKAERTELREALQAVMNYPKARWPSCEALEKARAVLAKGKA